MIIRPLGISIFIVAGTLLSASCGDQPPTPSTAVPIATTTSVSTTARIVADMPSDTAIPNATDAPTATPTPKPVPTATPIQTPTVTATATLTPTLPSNKMDEIDCEEPCAWDNVPSTSSVEWIQEPRISANGELSLIAQIHEEHLLILPVRTNGGVSNVALSDGPNLYGSVVPPSQPGWNWNPGPGLWVADTYTYQERTLTVISQIDPTAATHSGLRVCLWSGGAASEAYILACADIERP